MMTRISQYVTQINKMSEQGIDHADARPAVQKAAKEAHRIGNTLYRFTVDDGNDGAAYFYLVADDEEKARRAYLHFSDVPPFNVHPIYPTADPEPEPEPEPQPSTDDREYYNAVLNAIAVGLSKKQSDAREAWFYYLAGGNDPEEAAANRTAYNAYGDAIQAVMQLVRE